MLTDAQPAIFPHLELALVDANSLTRPRHVQLLRVIAHSHQTRRQTLPVDAVSRSVLRRLVQHEIEGVVREGQRLHLLLRLLGSDSVTIGGQMAGYGFLPCRMFRPTAAHLSAGINICMHSGELQPNLDTLFWIILIWRYWHRQEGQLGKLIR